VPQGVKVRVLLPALKALTKVGAFLIYDIKKKPIEYTIGFLLT
jgi:hypothetical protein